MSWPFNGAVFVVINGIGLFASCVLDFSISNHHVTATLFFKDMYH